MENITVKMTRNLAMIDLLKWVDENEVNTALAKGKNGGEIRIDTEGKISMFGRCSINDLFEIKCKFVVDEFTTLPNLLVKSKKGYHEELHASVYGIIGKVDDLISIYVIDTDKTMTLIYDAERGLVQEG